MAITETPVHFVPAYLEGPTATTFGYSALLMNASGDKVAFVVQCPKDGTLDKFEFMTGSVSNNPDNGIRCSFQDLDATTGLADGTQDQYRDITGTISGDTWQVPGLMTSDGTDGGVKRTVSSGEMIACCIEFVSFVASDSININTMASTTNNIAGGHYVLNGTTGTYTKASNVLPVVALKYNDGTYAKFHFPIGPWSALTNTAFNSSSSPDEYAMRLQVPIQCQAIGVWVRADIDNDVDVVLYDSGSTAQRTVSLDKDNQSAAVGQIRIYYFDAITISANTTYRIALKPSSTSNVTVMRCTIPSNSYLAALPSGSEWYESTRTDAGAWTDTDTNIPMMGLVINGYEATAGGSGGSFTFVG